MNKTRKVFTLPVILMLAVSLISPLLADQEGVSKTPKAEVIQKTQKLQMPFIANAGQINGRVKYYVRTFGGSVYVTKDGEIVYSLPKFEGKKESLPDPQPAIRNLKSDARGLVLKEEVIGGKASKIRGEEKGIARVNYFKGNTPSRWKRNIPSYNIVNLGEVYKGVELKLKAYGNNVEKLFCVKPDTDPSSIKIKLSGARSLKVNEKDRKSVV